MVVLLLEGLPILVCLCELHVFYLYLSPFFQLLVQSVAHTVMGSGWSALPIWSGYTFSVLALCRSQLVTGFAQIVLVLFNKCSPTYSNTNSSTLGGGGGEGCVDATYRPLPPALRSVFQNQSCLIFAMVPRLPQLFKAIPCRYHAIVHGIYMFYHLSLMAPGGL